jgi:hypothetical protein
MHGDNTAVPSCAPLNNSPVCPQLQHRPGAFSLASSELNALNLFDLTSDRRLGMNIDMPVFDG